MKFALFGLNLEDVASASENAKQIQATSATRSSLPVLLNSQTCLISHTSHHLLSGNSCSYYFVYFRFCTCEKRFHYSMFIILIGQVISSRSHRVNLSRMTTLGVKKKWSFQTGWVFMDSNGKTEFPPIRKWPFEMVGIPDGAIPDRFYHNSSAQSGLIHLNFFDLSYANPK